MPGRKSSSRPSITFGLPRKTPAEGCNIMDEFIAGNTQVSISAYVAHRDENVFPTLTASTRSAGSAMPARSCSRASSLIAQGLVGALVRTLLIWSRRLWWRRYFTTMNWRSFRRIGRLIRWSIFRMCPWSCRSRFGSGIA